MNFSPLLAHCAKAINSTENTCYSDALKKATPSGFLHILLPPQVLKDKCNIPNSKLQMSLNTYTFSENIKTLCLWMIKEFWIA